MQSCAIDKIREAELEAGVLLSRASQQAEEILRDARSQAEAADRAARQAAEGVVALRLDQAERQVEHLKAEAREALEGELMALNAQALERRTAAVEKILRLIGAR
jgi:vacuolar-type H+-ATPase subunit H